MVEQSIEDYFPRNYPVKANDIEVKNGASIPTYPLMVQLQKMHENDKFYFILGSDLLPGLHTWDNGQELVEEINFIVFERKGYEQTLDPDFAQQSGYSLPNHYLTLKAQDNLIGMISSTEVRKRI